MLYLVLFSVFSTVFFLFLTVHHYLTQRQRHLNYRLQHYLGERIGEEEEKKGKKSFFTRTKRDKHKKGSKFLPEAYRKRVEAELTKASLPLRVEELFASQLVCGVLAGAAAVLLFHNILFSFLLAVGGLYTPILFLHSRRRGRVKRFDSQIADALVLMSNSLKAGYSFIQAMEMVAKEMPAPISEEFGRALKEMNLGVPTEESLLGINERLGSEDLDLVMTAVLTQRQVGGNLSEVLDNISFTIRERMRIKGEIRTVTAQGRMSGFIIGMLPIGLALIFTVINPGYLSVLFTTAMGLMMVGGAVIAEIIGVLLIRKIIRIEV